MSTYSNEIWILITRELSGEATPVEKSELRKWLAEDPKHLDFYSSIQSHWTREPGESVHSPFLFDLDSGREKLRNKLKQQSCSPSRQRKSQINFRPTQKRDYEKFTLRVAAAVILIIVLSSVLLPYHFWEQPESLILYSTSSLEQRIITLSDGSVVRLNQNSKLEIQENDHEEFRKFRLEGEAFFDVTLNSVHMQIESAGDHRIGFGLGLREAGRDDYMAAQQQLIGQKSLNSRGSDRSPILHLM